MYIIDKIKTREEISKLSLPCAMKDTLRCDEMACIIQGMYSFSNKYGLHIDYVYIWNSNFVRVN